MVAHLKIHLIGEHYGGGGRAFGNIKDPVIRIDSLHRQREIEDTKEKHLQKKKQHVDDGQRYNVHVQPFLSNNSFYKVRSEWGCDFVELFHSETFNWRK